MRGNRVARVLKIMALAAVGAAAFTYVVMRLWNWLTPALFGWHAITFWQALGVLVLSKILFGGFRFRRGPGLRWRRRMMERWERMTPEQREQFREGMRGRCGSFGAPAASQPKTVA
jgi:hypothetical protein